MSLQPQPLKNWPHNFDKKYVFKRLGIPDSPDDQQVLHDLGQEIFDIVAVDALNDGRAIANLFRSSSSRNQILFEWRKRLPRIPAAVRNHVTDVELLSGALYKFLNCVLDELYTDFQNRQNQPAGQVEGQAEGSKTAQQPAQQPAQQQTAQKSAQQPAQQQSEKSAQKQPEQPKKFNYHRPYIVPNVDVQIIRADHPDMPIAIRVSDFLTDRGNLQDVCPDGDWINIANIQFELFRQNLIQEGYLADGDTIWLNHFSLDQINPAFIANPQAGEVRLTSFNLASTLLRTIREHWPKLRNPSPDPYGAEKRSPLPRPNMTIIIRGGKVKGGALAAKQPALARPTVKLGGSTVAPNRRSEQMARYAAGRHAKTKRKMAEVEAEAGAEAGAETEAEANSPPAKRRRLAHKTVTAPAAGPAYAPAIGPALDPVPALAGQEPQEGDDDDAALLALLDPELFNEAGLAGDESAALQAFFEENEWAGEPMEEG